MHKDILPLERNLCWLGGCGWCHECPIQVHFGPLLVPTTGISKNAPLRLRLVVAAVIALKEIRPSSWDSSLVPRVIVHAPTCSVLSLASVRDLTGRYYVSGFVGDPSRNHSRTVGINCNMNGLQILDTSRLVGTLRE